MNVSRSAWFLSRLRNVSIVKKREEKTRLASDCYHSTLYYCSTKLWRRRRRYYIFRAKRAWHVAHFYFPRIRAAPRREAGKAQCMYIYYTYVQHRTTTGDNIFRTRGTFVLTLINRTIIRFQFYLVTCHRTYATEACFSD